MKLIMQPPDMSDKWIYIYDESGVLEIRVDYDDVDHKEVLRATRELIRIVNSSQ